MDFHLARFCASILWSSGMGLLLGKFHQILTELPASNMSCFSFSDDNLSNCQWIFTILAMCIYIVEVCFANANWQISSIYLPRIQ